MKISGGVIREQNTKHVIALHILTFSYDEITDTTKICGFAWAIINKAKTKAMSNLIKKKNCFKIARPFRNQITVKIGTSTVVKFFENGSVLITGCKRKKSGVDCLNDIIKKTGSHTTIDKKLFEYNMICCNFTITNKDIDRRLIHAKLVKDGRHIVMPLGDKYPGLRLKYYVYNDIANYDNTTAQVLEWLDSIGCHECSAIFKKYKIDGVALVSINEKVLIRMGINNNVSREKILKPIIQMRSTITLLIFDTGKIIITGAKCFTHIIRAYSFIRKFINKCDLPDTTN